MHDAHQALLADLALRFQSEVRTDSRFGEPPSPLDDRVVSGSTGDLPLEFSLHLLNPYELSFSTTVTDQVTTQRIVTLVELLPRLARALYDAP